MPNGNVLVLCWERKTKAEAIAAGRRPELIPDGEVRTVNDQLQAHAEMMTTLLMSRGRRCGTI